MKTKRNRLVRAIRIALADPGYHTLDEMAWWRVTCFENAGVLIA